MKTSQRLTALGLVCIAVILLAPAAGAQLANASPRLFEFAGGMDRDRGIALSQASARQQSINVRFEAIASEEAKQIEIALFDGNVLQAVQRSSEGFVRHNADSFSWSGRIMGDNGWSGDVVLSVYKDAMAGSIHGPSGTYSILPQENGAHILVEVDQSAFPADDHDDTQIPPPSFGAADARQPESPQVDNGTQIDVLMVYTDDVRAFLGGTAQAIAFAQQAITLTNTVYQNSAITPRLRLVHTMELNYTELGNSSNDLSFIRSNQGVGIARDLYKADAVGFLVETSTSVCGVGYLMTSTSHSDAFAPNAFSVSVRSCAVSNITFSHELGHNQGCNHNPENAGTTPAQAVFPYSFGHYVNGGASPFRTVMSTTTNGICGTCPRIPYFSNPNVNYNGQPTGIVDQRDNARSIDNTALVFSRFRNSALAVTDLRSRKFHNGTPYDVDLRPGGPAVECRTAGAGGTHQVLITFVNPVGVGGVSVSSIDGQATATQSVNGSVVTVNLSSVANAQTVGITLTNVTTGPDTGNVFVPFKVLLGDANGDATVNVGDAQQTRNRSGEDTNATNFRSDFNLSGGINVGDAAIVRTASGTSAP